MGPLGMPELIVIFVIALLVFGPRKLPELGRSLGKSLDEFKRASNELRNTLEEEVRVEEQREATPARHRGAGRGTAPVREPSRPGRRRPGCRARRPTRRVGRSVPRPAADTTPRSVTAD